MSDTRMKRTAAAVIKFMDGRRMVQADFLARCHWSKAEFAERMSELIDAGVVEAHSDELGRGSYTCIGTAGSIKPDRYYKRTEAVVVEFMGDRPRKRIDFIHRFKWSRATFDQRMQDLIDRGVVTVSNEDGDEPQNLVYTCNVSRGSPLYPDSLYDARALAECFGGFTYNTKGL